MHDVRSFDGRTLRLLRGDITRVPVDALVNAANSELIGGGGVDGAVHRAGGPAIMQELNRIRPPAGCPTGSAVLTGAGELPAKWVVHAVGPVWHGGTRGEEADLRSAYAAAVRLASQKGARTMSFPSISTGVYGYPPLKAAPAALAAVTEAMRHPSCSVREAVFVLFDEETLAAYRAALSRLPL